MKKDKLVAVVIKACNKKDICAPATTVPQKTPNCPFQLSNTLFHNNFKANFGAIGNTPTRALLDDGLAAKNLFF